MRIKMIACAVALMGFASAAQAQDQSFFKDCDPKKEEVRKSPDYCLSRYHDYLARHVNSQSHVWEVFAEPASLVDYIEFGGVRVDAGNESGISGRLKSQYATALYQLDPIGKGWAADAIRNLLGNPVTFRVMEPLLRARAVKAIREKTAVGAVQTVFARVKPVLNKPIDGVVAAAGMKWLYVQRCLEEEYREAPECRQSRFPTVFRGFYGIEPTIDAVDLLGFLFRRAMEHPDLVGMWQQSILIGMEELN